ncbi:MAG: 5-(carboxyamino)imidazole ribonucleotide synthase [Sphingomonadales bacterium]|nr:5-(carboxyamino)imidazole ribonucleotide synthase [Sphingomonadales bacterium]
MKSPFSSDFVLGILGGGQLGRMLLDEARRLNLKTRVLDSSHDAPCAHVCDEYVLGNLLHEEDVIRFGRSCDVLTLEIEHVHAGALRKLRDAGVVVHPNPEALTTIQDKSLQKQWMISREIPTTPVHFYDGLHPLRDAIRLGRQSLPAFWKSCRLGYDGKGVRSIRSEADIIGLPDLPCLVEEAVDLASEVAVLVARNAWGETTAFPPCEMVFHPDANLVEEVLMPARLPADRLRESVDIAKRIITDLDVCGLLAIEFFYTRDGRWLVNEMAPRPHNSGHVTIEVCNYSQYAQHLRGILNLPLHTPECLHNGLMVNLMGAEGHVGPAWFEGADALLGEPGVYLHAYGKSETRPMRKMGHFTIVGSDPETIIHRARELKKRIRVVATSGKSRANP